MAVGLCLAGLAGCGTPVPAPAPAVASSAAADRSVCIDLDARGGALYRTFVVPMMAGPDAGTKSVGVDVAQMARAVQPIKGVGQGQLGQASPEIAEQGQRLVAAAEAFGLYQHAEGTALLTAFVSLSIACQQAGHQPSWFDAVSLAGG